MVHLVDDDEAVRRSASFMLRTSGYVVKTWLELLRQRVAGGLASGREIKFPSAEPLRDKVKAQLRGVSASAEFADNALNLQNLRLKVDLAKAALEKRRLAAELVESTRQVSAEMDRSEARLAGLRARVRAQLTLSANTTVGVTSMKTGDTAAVEGPHRRRRARVDARIALAPALADLDRIERELLLGRLKLTGLKGRVRYGLRHIEIDDRGVSASDLSDRIRDALKHAEAAEFEKVRKASEELQTRRRQITSAWEIARANIIRKMLAATRRPVFRSEAGLSFYPGLLSESEAEWVRRGGDEILRQKIEEIDAAWTTRETEREAQTSSPATGMTAVDTTPDDGLTPSSSRHGR